MCDSSATICKSCNLCQTQWHSWEAFVEDRSLQVNGYQASFTTPEDGVILLTHNVEHCGSTMAVRAGDLKSLYRGPHYTIQNHGSTACPGHCTDPTRLEACNQECEMHWVREILQFLRQHRIPEVVHDRVPSTHPLPH
jgi:hypothetical protein